MLVCVDHTHLTFQCYTAVCNDWSLCGFLSSIPVDIPFELKRSLVNPLSFSHQQLFNGLMFLLFCPLSLIFGKVFLPF
jgi:hypothetical protein